MASDSANGTYCAQILPFERPRPVRRGRGRPRKETPRVDYGTPELMMKRAQGATAETLDICLERQLISPRQHWCGIHLRWLYTLRHGAPSLRALNPAHLGGQPVQPCDAQWRAEREQEYRDAMQALALSGQVSLLMNICVYNERPAFLTPAKSKAQAQRALESLEGLIKGLDILVALWRRRSL